MSLSSRSITMEGNVVSTDILGCSFAEYIDIVKSFHGAEAPWYPHGWVHD